MTPIQGGQYRFIYNDEPNTTYIGVFHTFYRESSEFDVDLYVEAFTPSQNIPNKYSALLGLPDLKRCEAEPTRKGIKINEVTVVQRLYICYDLKFWNREVQWRMGYQTPTSYQTSLEVSYSLR